MTQTAIYGSPTAPQRFSDDAVRYCLYVRKSSEAEEKQALSVESQVKEMLLVAERDHLNVVDIYRESHSAKACGQRPVYNQLLSDVREEKFNGILVWHPDRSRTTGQSPVVWPERTAHLTF